jgi:hypothetical protein
MLGSVPAMTISEALNTPKGVCIKHCLPYKTEGSVVT